MTPNSQERGQVKHTPGPWIAERSNTHERFFYVGPQYSDGKGCDFVCTLSMPNAENDARLIAAAPALLEALQAMVRSFGNDDTPAYKARDAARAAIALATGETTK